MPSDQSQEQIRVVCTECHFSQVVEKEGEKSAQTIIDHGKETGHTVITEEIDSR